jgi:hypothetical protein
MHPVIIPQLHTRSRTQDPSLTFPVKDDSGARTPQCFVCCGGDNVAVLKGTWYQAGCHKTADMSHIRQQVGIHVVGYLSESFVVQIPRVAAHSL